eukprot:s6134_g1.t1
MEKGGLQDSKGQPYRSVEEISPESLVDVVDGPGATVVGDGALVDVADGHGATVVGDGALVDVADGHGATVVGDGALVDVVVGDGALVDVADGQGATVVVLNAPADVVDGPGAEVVGSGTGRMNSSLGGTAAFSIEISAGSEVSTIKTKVPRVGTWIHKTSRD